MSKPETTIVLKEATSIEAISTQVAQLFTQYHLNDWTFEVAPLKYAGAAGYCLRSEKKIQLAPEIFGLESDAFAKRIFAGVDPQQTLLHEIAHALTLNHGHDVIWRHVAHLLGVAKAFSYKVRYTRLIAAENAMLDAHYPNCRFAQLFNLREMDSRKENSELADFLKKIIAVPSERNCFKEAGPASSEAPLYPQEKNSNMPGPIHEQDPRPLPGLLRDYGTGRFLQTPFPFLQTPFFRPLSVHPDTDNAVSQVLPRNQAFYRLTDLIDDVLIVQPRLNL